MDEVAAALRAHAGRRVVVLASGDPGFFGIAASRCGACCPRRRSSTLPGVSSAQLAAARLGRPWHDLVFASAHGARRRRRGRRRAPRIRGCWRSPTRGTARRRVAAALAAAGIAAAVTVLERLGEADETHHQRRRGEIAAGEFDGLSVVFIEREEPA